jgi:DNA-directed RNA polymerase subunit RPC12/RpoP
MEKNPFEFGNFGFSRQPVRQEADFDQLEATELYCVECRRAVPVRKSLLLVLPEGDKYEYRCQYCGSTVGDKIDHSGQFQRVFRG